MSDALDLDTWNGTGRVARYLRLQQPAVQQAIYRGTLPAIRHGFLWLVHRDDVLEYERRLIEREQISERARAWRETQQREKKAV